MFTGFYNRQTGNNKCSSTERINNKNMVYSQCRTVSKNKKKWTTDTCNMNKSQNTYATWKWVSQVKKSICCIPLRWLGQKTNQ